MDDLRNARGGKLLASQIGGYDFIPEILVKNAGFPTSLPSAMSRPACLACHVRNEHIRRGRQWRAGLWGCGSGRFSSTKRLQNGVW